MNSRLFLGKKNKNPQIKTQILLERTNMVHLGSQPFLPRDRVIPWQCSVFLCCCAMEKRCKGSRKSDGISPQSSEPESRGTPKTNLCVPLLFAHVITDPNESLLVCRECFNLDTEPCALILTLSSQVAVIKFFLAP